jgi:hypothetical protein
VIDSKPDVSLVSGMFTPGIPDAIASLLRLSDELNVNVVTKAFDASNVTDGSNSDVRKNTNGG